MFDEKAEWQWNLSPPHGAPAELVSGTREEEAKLWQGYVGTCDLCDLGHFASPPWHLYSSKMGFEALMCTLCASLRG